MAGCLRVVRTSGPRTAREATMHLTTHRSGTDPTGLGLWYRFCWRLSYTALSLYGPAELGSEQDPRRAMRRERQARTAMAGRPRTPEISAR